MTLEWPKGDRETRCLPMEMLSLLNSGTGVYLSWEYTWVTWQILCAGAKRQQFWEGTRAKLYFWLRSPSAFLVDFQLSKKNPFAWKVRIFFLTSPMHVHCFSVRSSSSFGNEVVDERSGARGVKKKNCLNCSNLSSLGDWCVSFISQETGVATTPELAPDFTLLVCKISITALRT